MTSVYRVRFLRAGEGDEREIKFGWNRQAALDHALYLRATGAQWATVERAEVAEDFTPRNWKLEGDRA